MAGSAAGMTVGVAGAGTMGAGIAQVAAWAGHPVVLYDIEQDYVDGGLAKIGRFLQRGVEKGKHGQAEVDAALARIDGVTELADMADCGIVIEAAPERLDLKQSLFAGLESHLSDEAILATNTSTLSVAAIAGGLSRPQRLCGMHFFNPAPLLPLVEVIRAPDTLPMVAETVIDLAKAWGKSPILVEDRPGFIVNRVARPFYGEALRLLGDQVADVETIDRLARDAGFPLGPFQLMDLIGVDVNYAAAESVWRGFFQDPRFQPHPIQRAMAESGRLGRKCGRGYYEYGE